MTTSKNDKTDGERWNMLGRIRKNVTQQIKQTVPLEETNQKLLAKEERLKIYRDRMKVYWQHRTFQNNKKKNYLQVGRECTETYQQPDEK